MASLFGSLVTRFTKHPENLASEALAYILRESPTARLAFIQCLSEIAPGLPTDLVFRTQAAGEDDAIPDIVGVDEENQQIVIAEAKFWAGLTDNQPCTYLKRLPPNRPGLLVFIAPEARMQTLSLELLRRCEESGMLRPTAGEAGRLPLRFGDRHWLALTSWRAIIRVLEAKVVASGEDRVRADLQQLDGLCESMDSAAFLPIRSEELSPLIGKRIGDYCNLINDIVERLIADRICDTNRLRKTGMEGRWGRYIRIRGNGCFLHFSAPYWAIHRETPIWLSVTDHNFKRTAEMRAALAPLEREVPPRLVVDNDGQLLVPLFLKIGAERDAVMQHLVVQIRQIVGLLPDHTREAVSEQAPDPEGD
jgi:hypothetical protein